MVDVRDYISGTLSRVVSQVVVQRNLVCELPPAVFQNCAVMFKEVSDTVLDFTSRLCPNCITP